MPNSERSIIPESVITQLAERKKTSMSGLPKRRTVTVGHTEDGEAYVQLGSVVQVSFALDIENESPLYPRTLTPGDIFRLSDDFFPSELIEGVRERNIQNVRSSVKAGEDLIEGSYAIPTVPGQPSQFVPNVKAVWSPLTQALGEEWNLLEK